MTVLHLPLVKGADLENLPWKAVCGAHVLESDLDFDGGLCPDCSEGENLSVADALVELEEHSDNGMVPQSFVQKVMHEVGNDGQYPLTMQMVRENLRQGAVNVVDREEPDIENGGDAETISPEDLWTEVGNDGYAEDNSDPSGTTELEYFRPRSVEGSFGTYVLTNSADPSPWRKLAQYDASSGSGILLYCPADDTIFLMLRSAECSEPGTWAIPGGGTEPGESPIHSALREFDEEAGGLPNVEPLDTVEYVDGDFTYTTFVFSVEPGDKRRFVPHLNSEHTEADWFDVNQLPEPLHFGIKYLQEQLPQIFQVRVDDQEKEATPGGWNLLDLTTAENRSPLGPDTSTNETSWGWKGADLLPGNNSTFPSDPSLWAKSYSDENDFEDLDKLGCLVEHKWAKVACPCCTGKQASTVRQACFNCNGQGKVLVCAECGRSKIGASVRTASWIKRADAVKRITQFGSLPIHLEYNKGDIRTGTSPDGKQWQRLMHCGYGFIPGTIGDDGEPVDVYLGGASSHLVY